jgi:hypothetical protein
MQMGRTSRCLTVNVFQATVGSTDLVTPETGESRKTSAASVVMFGKDGKVIWRPLEHPKRIPLGSRAHYHRHFPRLKSTLRS